MVLLKRLIIQMHKLSSIVLAIAAISVPALPAISYPRPIPTVAGGACPSREGYVRQGNQCVPTHKGSKEVIVKQNYGCPRGWLDAHYWCIAP